MGPSFQFKIFLNLIRSLFPSWNFFDQLAYTFELNYKIQPDQQWRCISFQQIQKLRNIVFNPAVNLSLAQFNIVEHFSRDLQELDLSISILDEEVLQKLSSYRLLKSLVAVKLQEINEPTNHFQFKIVALNKLEKIEIYTSGWISE